MPSTKGRIYKYISKPWNEAELKRLVDEASELFQVPHHVRPI